MATTKDLGTMRARIISEMERPDLQTEAGEAVLSAIEFYKGEPVVSNETTTGWLSTVASQRDYTLPSDFIAPLCMSMSADGSVTNVVLRTRNEMMAMDTDADDPQTGTPLYYGLFNGIFMFWPRSDDASKLYQLDYVSSLAAPEEDDDDGFWMNEAERAVRCRAKGILYDDILQVGDKADRQFTHSDMEWKQIRARLELRVYARGRRPWVPA